MGKIRGPLENSSWLLNGARFWVSQPYPRGNYFVAVYYDPIWGFRKTLPKVGRLPPSPPNILCKNNCLTVTLEELDGKAVVTYPLAVPAPAAYAQLHLPYLLSQSPQGFLSGKRQAVVPKTDRRLWPCVLRFQHSKHLSRRQPCALWSGSNISINIPHPQSPYGHVQSRDRLWSVRALWRPA